MNRSLAEMLQHHPLDPVVDQALLAGCIAALFECAGTCNICADACLHEPDVQDMRGCITLNHDCVSACLATAQLLGRQSPVALEALVDQLQACANICRACGEECARHAGHMEHCRICADICRECANACEQVLDSLQA